MSKRHTRGQRTGGAGSTVKTELRVLQLLEYFTRVNREVTVMEVARALAIPQSSTSELLCRLTEQGYLARDLRRRLFRPTARIALIGAQLMPQAFGDRKILRAMEALSERTGGPATLNRRSGTSTQIIHVVHPSGAASVVHGPGLRYPIVNSTPGRLMLSMISESDVCSLVRRHNAEASTAKARIDVRPLLRELMDIRARGYALSRRSETPPPPLNLAEHLRNQLIAPSCLFEDSGRLSILVPSGDPGEHLTITVGCPDNPTQPEERDYVRMVQGVLSHFTGKDRDGRLYFLPHALEAEGAERPAAN